MVRSGSDFELPFRDCLHTHFFYQAFYPFSAAPGPLRPQLIVNARATISFTVLFINGLYFFFQFKVLLFTATFAAATPLIITTRRDFKYPAHLLNAIVFMLFSNLADDPIVHCWGFGHRLVQSPYRGSSKVQLTILSTAMIMKESFGISYVCPGITRPKDGGPAVCFKSLSSGPGRKRYSLLKWNAVQGIKGEPVLSIMVPDEESKAGYLVVISLQPHLLRLSRL